MSAEREEQSEGDSGVVIYTVFSNKTESDTTVVKSFH